MHIHYKRKIRNSLYFIQAQCIGLQIAVEWGMGKKITLEWPPEQLQTVLKPAELLDTNLKKKKKSPFSYCVDCLPRRVSLWAVSGVQFPFQKHRTQGAPAVFTFTCTPGLRPFLISLCFSFLCQLCLLGPDFHCSSDVTLWNSTGNKVWLVFGTSGQPITWVWTTVP